MASTLKINTLTGVTTAGSIAVTGEGNSTTTNLQQGLTKAFVNFDGSGTVSIRDSVGVSSLADDGTGAYTVTLSITMSTATDWSGAISGNGAGYSHAFGGTSGAFTATTFPVAVRTGGNVNADINLIVGQVFGALA